MVRSSYTTRPPSGETAIASTNRSRKRSSGVIGRCCVMGSSPFVSGPPALEPRELSFQVFVVWIQGEGLRLDLDRLLLPAHPVVRLGQRVQDLRALRLQSRGALRRGQRLVQVHVVGRA